MDLIFASAPIVLLVYWMVKPQPLASHHALPLAALSMYLIRLVYFADDSNLVNATVLHGALSALIPVSIIAGAIFLFKSMEKTGAMAFIRSWLNQVTRNSVAQYMIIGWAFSFMIEGASGFGTPAALAGPILVGLGMPAFKVAVFCLIMNSVPVSFGAVGTPTWYGFEPVLAQIDTSVSSQFLLDVSWKIVTIHAVAALIVPPMALILTVGWGAFRKNALFVFLSILSCVVPYFILGFFSYEFPALIAGMLGFGLSVMLAAKNIGLEKTTVAVETERVEEPQKRGLVKALFPLWGTVALLLVTRIPHFGVKSLLTQTEGGMEFVLGSLGQFAISPSLVISLEGIFDTEIAWSYQLLYVPSLMPFFLISLLTFILYRSNKRVIGETFSEMAQLMKMPILALCAALIYVRLIMMGGDQSSAEIMGRSLAALTGEHWQYLASYLGALGSFFSGSGTISNLTFSSIQYSVAENLELSTSTILALQSVGGAMGNMVCINNIVAICSILGVSQFEGKILRMNLIPMAIYGVIAAEVSSFFPVI